MRGVSGGGVTQIEKRKGDRSGKPRTTMKNSCKNGMYTKTVGKPLKEISKIGKENIGFLSELKRGKGRDEKKIGTSK